MGKRQIRHIVRFYQHTYYIGDIYLHVKYPYLNKKTFCMEELYNEIKVQVLFFLSRWGKVGFDRRDLFGKSKGSRFEAHIEMTHCPFHQIAIFLALVPKLMCET